MNLNQVTLPAIDMRESVRFYLSLGFIQIVDTAHYARFMCLEGEATFSLSLVEETSTSNTTIYFEDKHLDSTVERLRNKGIVFESMPEDKPYLWREAELHDPAGNKIKMYWAGENRLNPPWRVDKTG